jgi:hypothetical protein
MTTGRWIILAALTAVSLKVWDVSQRRYGYIRWRLSGLHRIEPLIEIAFGECAQTGRLNDAERYSRLLLYYRQLIAKYEWAARYPWLPVAPDPPEPN